MKEIDELNIPADISYTEDHEWAQQDGDLVVIGISDYAQDQLGDIVYVEFPEIGDSFDKAEEFGTLESVKAVSELYLPLGGEIVAINEALSEAPELLNEDPYTHWIIKIRPTDIVEFEGLMNGAAYLEYLQGNE